MFKKLISILLSFTFITTQPVFAQGVAQLNMAQYLGSMPAVAADRFRPLHMRYFSYDIEKDNFQLLLDKGDNKDIKEAELQEKTKVLMEYFQIGLALPNDKFWVNLRPDAEDQMIDPELEKTDMGKIMLEADLQLKKDTAQWTSPQTTEGRQYWDKLYKKAGELFGTENITIPTITRPWIVPGEIILREGEGSAYIFKANMKVLLEEDYLSSQPSAGQRAAVGLPIAQAAISSQQYNFKDPRMKKLNQYSTQLIRELILPKLNKEVNTSKRYAALRQVFFSLVMARWFKDTFQGKPGQYAQLIDSHNLNNLTSKEAWSKTYYFNEYKKSFEKGEYNLKEQIYTPTGQVIRSYVSGGVSSAIMTRPHSTYHNVNGKHLGAVNVGYNNGKSYIQEYYGVGKKRFSSVTGSSPIKAMSEEEMDSLSSEESENRRKNLELNMWIRVDDIKKILAKALDSIDINDDFLNIRKDVNGILMYLNTFNNRDARIEGKHINTIVEMLSKRYFRSNKFLVNILPKGYSVQLGPRLVTLNGSISKLKHLQEDWEKLEIDVEAVVKRIIGQTGVASKKDIEDIVKEFRKELGRNPTVKEAGEILGDAFMRSKSVSEIAKTKIEELKQEAPLAIDIGNVIKKIDGYLEKINSKATVEAVKKEIIAFGEKPNNRQSFIKLLEEQAGALDERVRAIQEWSDSLSGPLTDNAIEYKAAGINDQALTVLLASDLKALIKTLSVQEEKYKLKSSSALERPGGIDFRTMNYMVQPMGSFKDLRFGLPTLTSSALEMINLDQELTALRAMVKAGMVPAGERVKEYLAACFQKGKIEEKQDDLLVCLAEIYRLAEEENLETSPELRESLVIVDTGKFVLLPNSQKVGLN